LISIVVRHKCNNGTQRTAPSAAAGLDGIYDDRLYFPVTVSASRSTPVFPDDGS
jgi:hypothetical protein